VAAPRLHLAQPAANAEETVRLARIADERGAALDRLPRARPLGLTADDLFHQQGSSAPCARPWRPWWRQCQPRLRGGDGRADPARSEALQLRRGGPPRPRARRRPKAYLPNYREYYEKRQFSRAAMALTSEIDLAGQTAPFGAAVFRARGLPAFAIHVEVCEDLWVPVPPSTWGALAGATVLCNLSASHAAVGKADYRDVLCASQSGRCVAAYLYAGAGYGESTTDLAWDNQGMIFENGIRLAAVERSRSRARSRSPTSTSSDSSSIACG
jgi:NAD+ synthase (glutamine-hydrolysing)